MKLFICTALILLICSTGSVAMEPKVLLFDTGVAFILEEHTILIHKGNDNYSIYNGILTEDEIKRKLEPWPYYGMWGSDEAMKRQRFFESAKATLSRETYLELVNQFGSAVSRASGAD